MAATIEAPKGAHDVIAHVEKAAARDPDRDHVVRDVAGVKVRMHRADAEYHDSMTGTKGVNVVRLAALMTRGVRLGDTDASPQALRVRADEVLGRWSRDLTQPGSRRKLTKPQLRKIATAGVREASKQLREKAKREAKAGRERAALMAKIDRAREQVRERYMRQHPEVGTAYVSLPDKVRPTRATGKDKTKPILEGAAIRKVGRGRTARWVLQVTDSYGLLQLPLVVAGNGAIRETWVSPEALKAIEASRHFRVEQGGVVQPLALRSVSAGVTKVKGADLHDQQTVWIQCAVPLSTSYRPTIPLDRWPKFEQLLTGSPPASQTVRVKFDADMCGKITAAAGKDKLGLVELVIDLRACEKRPDGERWFTGTRPDKRKNGGRGQQPLIVANVPEGAEALLMPVRIGV